MARQDYIKKLDDAKLALRKQEEELKKNYPGLSWELGHYKNMVAQTIWLTDKAYDYSIEEGS